MDTSDRLSVNYHFDHLGGWATRGSCTAGCRVRWLLLMPWVTSPLIVIKGELIGRGGVENKEAGGRDGLRLD